MCQGCFSRSLHIEHLEDRRTLAADNADFNDSGMIDALDLPIWQSGYGTSDLALQSEGDADGDQDIDGRDFLIWQR
jgi:hypothetical protein